MSKLYTISHDTRATGQGKTYSAMRYCIEQMLDNKIVSVITANNSNKNDLKITLYDVVDIFKEFDFKNFYVKNTYKLENFKADLIYAKKEQEVIKKLLKKWHENNEYYLQKKENHDILERYTRQEIREKLLQNYRFIDDLKNNIEWLTNTLHKTKIFLRVKNNKYAKIETKEKAFKNMMECLINKLLNYHYNSYFTKNKFLPTFNEDIGMFPNYYRKKIIGVDELIIDECDKALSLLSVDEGTLSLDAVFINLPIALNKQQVEICREKEIPFYYNIEKKEHGYNKEYKESFYFQYGKLKKEDMKIKKEDMKKITVFYIHGLVIASNVILKKLVTIPYFEVTPMVSFREMITLPYEKRSEYKKQKIREIKNVFNQNNFLKYNPIVPFTLLCKKESISINDVEGLINGIIKDNSHITLLGATKNVFVDNLLSKGEKVPVPYDTSIFHKKIDFEIRYLEDYSVESTAKDKIVYIFPSLTKSAIAIKNSFYLNDKNCTYINNQELVGSNKFKDVDGFAYIFDVNDVRQAPLASGIDKDYDRAKFLVMVGNYGITNNDQLKLWRTMYNFKTEDFARQVTNRIIQSVGRLNRGKEKKIIYVKKNSQVSKIIIDTIKNQLKQNII